MMIARDLRHPAQVAGPGNLLEKIVAVHHVRFHFRTLVGVERSFTHGEQAHLLGRQQWTLRPVAAGIGFARDFLQHFEGPLRLHAW